MPEKLFMVDTGGYDDGYVYKTASLWADARGASTGTYAYTTGTYGAYAIRSQVSAGRGSTTTYIARAFFQFNTTSITTKPNSATLHIYGRTFGNGRVNCVKAASSMPLITTADFDNIDGWDTTGTDGSGGGNNASNVTYYANELGSWTTSGYNEFTLNDDALNDMTNFTVLAICLLDRYDLRDLAHSPTGSNLNGVYFSEYSGTTRAPKIEYEPATPSVFFGANF